jgi:hypothetical protein
MRMRLLAQALGRPLVPLLALLSPPNRHCWRPYLVWPAGLFLWRAFGLRGNR